MSQKQQGGIQAAVQVTSSLSTTEAALGVDSAVIPAIKGEENSGSRIVAPPIGWSESSTTFEKFELFPKLPIELRLKIWKYTARGPRIIEVTFERDAYYQKSKNPADTSKKGVYAGVYYRHRCISKSGRLGTLWANSEARQETLKCNPAYLQMDRGQKIYFNPAVDTIFVDLHSLYVMYDLFPFTRHARKSPSRFRGFSKVQYLATSLIDNRIKGLRTLKRKVFTGLQAPISTINGIDQGPAFSQLLHAVVANLNNHMDGKNLTQKQQHIVDSTRVLYASWIGIFFHPDQ